MGEIKEYANTLIIRESPYRWMIVKKQDNGYTILDAFDKSSDGSYEENFTSIALTDEDKKRLKEWL